MLAVDALKVDALKHTDKLIKHPGKEMVHSSEDLIAVGLANMREIIFDRLNGLAQNARGFLV